MEFCDILTEQGISPIRSRVLMMRHVPTEPELRRVFPWLAADRPKLFDAYQQSHSRNGETQLRRADYLASFIGVTPKEALFIGLYRVAGFRSISYAEYWKKTTIRELAKLGMTGWIRTKQRPTTLWFDLRPESKLEDMKGRLVVHWTSERAWIQRAVPGKHGIHALHYSNSLVEEMPEWNQLQLTWEELEHLPSSWGNKLSQWRGVYFILDSKDGRGYVGSAYGNTNLYGRWKNYGQSGDGGNKRLRSRNPSGFRFSILELVSPTMKPDEVIALENTWKERLHTREFGLNIN